MIQFADVVTKVLVILNIAFYFFAETKASERITVIISNRNFCKDVAKLILLLDILYEAFHSALIPFVPKHPVSVSMEWLQGKLPYTVA